MSATHRTGRIRAADRARRLLWVASAMCAVAGAQAGEGIVRYDMDGKTYLYTTQSTAPIGPIQAQYADADGKARCCVIAMAKGPALKQEDRLATDELKTEPVQMYRLEVASMRETAPHSPFVGAALFGGEPSLKQISAAELSIGEAKNASRVLTCVSKEGMHLLKVSSGSVQAHLYFSFGYEVKPSCSSKAMKLIKRG